MKELISVIDSYVESRNTRLKRAKIAQVQSFLTLGMIVLAALAKWQFEDLGLAYTCLSIAFISAVIANIRSQVDYQRSDDTIHRIMDSLMKASKSDE